MNDYQYLVDNNVLSRLSRDQRASQFFRSRCHLPTEVLYEARGLPDIDQLKLREYETTPSVLRQLAHVLDKVPADDTKLIDLYTNTGNADPLIVACALDAIADNDDKLFGPTSIVVSDDNAVRTTAGLFGITVHDQGELKTLIDSQDSQP